MEELINDNTIIKNDLYNMFKSSIECSLCLNILINPVMCLNCQNAFCKKCIDNWSKNSEKCPNRCDNPNYQKCIGKNDILSKLLFKCKGCDNPIEYDNVRKHYSTCCPDKIPIEKEENNKIEENNKVEEKNKVEENNKMEEKKKVEENNNIQKKSKFEKISRDEIEILKNKGNEFAYITGKTKFIIFLIILYSYYFRFSRCWKN